MKTTIAALLITASLAAAQETTKATACFEKGGAHVRLVDAEGKKHRYTVFPLVEKTDMELAEFENSRRVVAMDDGAILYIKQGKDERGEWVIRQMGPIAECKASKRASFPKL